MLNEFKVLRKIGEGSFGTVFKVRRKFDQKIYAMKKVRLASYFQNVESESYQIRVKDEENKNKLFEIRNALNEVRVLASVDHPNVIKFYEAFVDTNDLSLW